MLNIKNILLATDFSEGAEQALAEALALARRHGAALRLLHVVTVPERMPKAIDLLATPYKEEARRDLEAQASARLDELLETSRPEGPVKAVVRRGKAAAPVVLKVAAEQDTDLIVVGAHGRRGFRRLFAGSTSEEIVRRADRPVLVVHRREEEEDAPSSAAPAARVMVPVDFSEHSRRAVRYGREWAEARSTALDLVHVIEEPPPIGVYGIDVAEPAEIAATDVREETARELRSLFEEGSGPDVPVEAHVLDGHTPSAIVNFAREQKTGLVVMASHGRTGLERLLIGSVSAPVVRKAPCPVFVVRSFGKSLLAGDDPRPSSSRSTLPT